MTTGASCTARRAGSPFMALIVLQLWTVLCQPEQSLLYDFYNSTSGWASDCSRGWSTNITPLCSGSNSSWAKITCTDGAVTLIDLSNCGIRGTLPHEWSSMTRLQDLRLFSNSIVGTLPAQWSSMSGMQYLRLHNNFLNGTLPVEWSSMSGISFLYLYNNSIRGVLPHEWGNLTGLQYLSLFSNSLRGTLPPEWSGMTNLQYLWLYANSLSGTLPPQWARMTNLHYLHLYGNIFNGTLPPQWSNMRSMEDLRLFSNAVSGALPSQWSIMTNLQTLSLAENSLTGTLPPQWSNLTSVNNIDLHINALRGTLPPEWSNLTALQRLYLYNNSLSGTLPSEWNVIQWCDVSNNCLNTSHATGLWAESSRSSLLPQKAAGCALAPVASHNLSAVKSHSQTDYTPSTTLNLPTIVRKPHDVSPIAVAFRNAAGALVMLPMLVSGSITVGASTVQLSVASSLLSRRRRQRADIDGIGSSILENPLQLRLPSFSQSLQMTGGAVIGNVVVCLAVVMCSALVAHVTEHGRRQCDPTSVWRMVRGYVVERFPGALLSPLGLLLEPTFSSSFSLLISPNRSAASCVVGAVGATVLVGGLGWTTAVVRAGLLNEFVAYKENRPSGNSWCHAVPHGHWVVSTTSTTDRLFFERFSPFFIENLGSRSMYFAFDLWTTVAVAFVAAIGLSLDDDGVVAPAGDVLCGIALLRLICVVVLRPLSVAPSNAFAALLEALSVVCTLLSCLDASDENEEVVLWLTVVQTSIILLQEVGSLRRKVRATCHIEENDKHLLIVQALPPSLRHSASWNSAALIFGRNRVALKGFADTTTQSEALCKIVIHICEHQKVTRRCGDMT